MDEPLVDREFADNDAPRRGGPWKLIALVVVVTAIAVWLVPSKKPEPAAPSTAPMAEARPSIFDKLPPTAAGTPPVEADIAPLPSEDAPVSSEPELIEPPRTETADESTTAADGEAQTSAPVINEPVIDDTPGAHARAMIAAMREANAVDPDALLAAAQQAQQKGEKTDAYLLYFFAAREGQADAALALGKQVDPASFDPATSVFDEADLGQAHKWYQLAAQNGSAEGRSLLAALRSRVEKLAAEGDQQAQRISLLWQ